MSFLEGIFNGTGGGLLDFLRSNAMNQRFDSGPDQAQYGQQPMEQAPMLAANQPSPLDNARWPAGPVAAPSADPAAIPPNARPVQGLLAEPAFAAPQEEPNRLLTGLQGFSGNLHNGLIGAIAGGIGAATTGQRTDPAGIAELKQRQTYQALVPILGEQKARLAILNPEIGKAMVAQALAGKQYAFTTAPDGTVIRTDAHAGTAEPVYQAGLKPTFGVVSEQDGQKTYGWIDPGKRTTTPVAAPAPRSETIPGPDGKPIAIPPNVDRKAFVGEISRANAKAAAGEKTEVQAKSEKFGNKMELAERNLKDIEGEGASALGRMTEGSGWLPGSAAVGRYAQSDNYQKYRQARDNFITALLRDESGAAIGTDEFNRYEKELFPQPGDGPGVIKQKREARRIAIEGMKKAAGPGYKSPTFDDAGDTPAGVDAKVWNAMTPAERALWK